MRRPERAEASEGSSPASERPRDGHPALGWPGPQRASEAGRPRKQEQERASEEVAEVAPGIIRMQLPVWMPGLGHVNMYGLVDDRGIAVVDPGLPGPTSWKALKQRLRSAGYRVKDIHTVVVTHSHPDHFGAAGRIAREANADLIAHKAFVTWSLERRYRKQGMTLDEAVAAERQAAAISQAVDLGPEVVRSERLAADDEFGGRASGANETAEAFDDPLRDDPTMERQRASTPWGGDTPWGGSKHPMPPLRRRMMIRALGLLFTPPDPNRRVGHGETVQLGGREWSVVHTPGHTLDHLCLWDADQGILLCGDHVLPTITPHVSGVGEGADALRSYMATLDLVADLDGVRLGLPAHGHPFDDVPGRVEAIKRHHFERMEQLRDAGTALGPATVKQLSHEVFPKRHWGSMAESETFAHLEHLVRAGQAERRREDGDLLYEIGS